MRPTATTSARDSGSGSGSGAPTPRGGGGGALKRLHASLKAAGALPSAAPVPKKKNKRLAAPSNNSNSGGGGNDASLSLKAKAKLALRALDAKNAAANPFDMQFSRHKHSVLNRKVKGQEGRPLLQRKKAEMKRATTLAKELSTKSKAGAFVDRRFGENNPGMSVEDKMMERFLREKTRGSASKSSSLFNLEEEDLTHLGQSISGMDDYALESGLERVDDDEGNIDKSTVKFSHFGGFDDDSQDHKKSKSEIMAEVIAKSKFHKHERQKLNEEVLQLAQEVDDDLDNIKDLLLGSTLKSGENNATDANNSFDSTVTKKHRAPLSSQEDGYDSFIRELRGDTSRAAPSNRLKTEEEKALEEKQELEKLEAERLARMNKGSSRSATSANANKRRAAVADDLDDDFGTVANAISSRYSKRVRKGKNQKDDSEDAELEENDDEDGKNAAPLTYTKDGILINKNIFMRKRPKLSQEDGNGDSEENSDEDEDEDEDEDDDDDDDQEDNDESIEGETEDDGDEETGSENDESVDLDSEKNFHLDQNDLDSVNSDAQDEDGEQDKQDSAENPLSNAIPFTFIAPETHADFMRYVENLPPADQATVVHRIRVLYHVKLGGANRSKLETLLRILFEHIQFVLRKPSADLDVVNALAKHLHELSAQFPQVAAEICLRRIKKLHTAIQNSADKSAALPWIDDIVLLKTISFIFSVSDYEHIVGTRAALLISEYLMMCPAQNCRQFLSGLILCQVFREFIKVSKRYVPEVIRFLLHMLGQLHHSSKSAISVLDMSCTPSSLDLGELLSKPTKADSQHKQFKTEEFKMSLLVMCINTVGQYSRIYSDAPAFLEMFSGLLDKLKAFDGTERNDVVGKALETNIGLVEGLLSSAKLKRKPLQLQKRKAMAIQTYVPKFDEHYSLDRRGGADRQRNETRKIKTQYTREFKGAVRELRKDGEFVARQRLAARAEEAAAYKKKMDRVMGDLANLEGAMRGIEKRKARK